MQDLKDIGTTPPTDRPLTEADKDVLLASYRQTTAQFATDLSNEQQRFDRLHRLFERWRALDELSQAARPHEARAIEAELNVLCPAKPTRRLEP
jgi:phytoene dehydrogenase-like protein